MASKAITDAPGASRAPRGAEVSPSAMRIDDPGISRYVGFAGAVLVFFGGIFLIANHFFNKGGLIGPAWSTLLLALGLVGLLYHAAFDRDVQFRRSYMTFAYAAIAVGAGLSLYPYPEKMGDQFPAGFLCLSVGLIFLLAFLRNEDELVFREFGQRALLVVGAILLAVGLVGGNVWPDFLPGMGLLCGLLGLLYLAAFLFSRGVSDDLAYYVGLGVGGVGALVIAFAIVRSAFYAGNGGFALVPQGLLLLLIGLSAVLLSVGFCSDAHLVVLTRRELGALFYSPLAYFVLFGFTLCAESYFYYWLDGISAADHPLPEPVIGPFLGNILFIIVTIAAVPVLTMRLFSEEKRTGTLEVMLTAPVNEPTIVLSKFLAAFAMFLLIWLPAVLYLVALRLIGGKPFDYRPALSFGVALFVTGANFVSMGLFFSSLTRNQLVSGVLTFTGMMGLTCLVLVSNLIRSKIWHSFIEHIAYLYVWSNAAQGKLIPPMLLFQASLTILFLFMTVKVLEARKWA